MADRLVEARDVVKHFTKKAGLFFGAPRTVRAVDGVSFTIDAGQTLGLVGESGCGKTTTSRLLLHLETLTSGSLTFEGKDIQSLDVGGRSHYRRAVQAVFQDPYSSLNPRMRIGGIIAEPIRANGGAASGDMDAQVRRTLDMVGLPARSATLFPHEFSGGQRQRIAIARALGVSPRLIVLDEPVSALDVSIRAQILNLLRDLQTELGVAYLFIAHDLAAVAHMSHTIAVMYLGRIVEMGDSEAIARRPRHPYTQALFAAALPSHPDERGEHEAVLQGEVPSPVAPPSGCHFHPRCPHAMPRCSVDEPRLIRAEQRLVACHLFEAESPAGAVSATTATAAAFPRSRPS
jgi:oligopeptide/dipeptide ABC transporter ATP-binding protein